MIIDLERPDTWPEPLASYLCMHHDVLLGWEKGDRSNGPHLSTARYDQIVYGLRAVLQPYSLAGLHCTKLAEEEIQHILENGMQNAGRQNAGTAHQPACRQRPSG